MYHDLGNLNISFMTTKEDYNRLRNLELICAAIRSVMDVDVSINKVIIALSKSIVSPKSRNPYSKIPSLFWLMILYLSIKKEIYLHSLTHWACTITAP